MARGSVVAFARTSGRRRRPNARAPFSNPGCSFAPPPPCCCCFAGNEHAAADLHDARPLTGRLQCEVEAFADRVPSAELRDAVRVGARVVVGRGSGAMRASARGRANAGFTSWGNDATGGGSYDIRIVGTIRGGAVAGRAARVVADQNGINADKHQKAPAWRPELLRACQSWGQKGVN